MQYEKDKFTGDVMRVQPQHNIYHHNTVIVDRNPYHPNQRLEAAKREIRTLTEPNRTIFNSHQCVYCGKHFKSVLNAYFHQQFCSRY